MNLNNREENDFFKILNLEKNLPCTGSDYRNICSKTINVKDLVAREAKTPFDNIDLQQQRNQRTHSSRPERLPNDTPTTDERERELNTLKETVGRLQETVCRLQGQVKEREDERDFAKGEAQRMFGDNNALVGKMGELSSELGMKV